MNEEIKNYLRENLQIRVEVYRGGSSYYDPSPSIKVILVLEDEEISESCESL